ncbi:hypothetical protein BBR47_51830 [Brevibacillus brevis NBRC 100599]|uniref:Prolow-density lipoprotein receptor-related protein 1-like beta-propeller domain-containing protein n=1 Tax=Brevibacillus brevis (strain 47 / JCM 6285 / NBRC 100599) TaxID=358681 RepID=C0Z5Q4_BREBN|nr:DUF5050 domain-containing protein [Brevibacillus brevis]BAH46160.1 hypothetical protein BBR47_51830 [Brevibacillus brevis NBRC 100599]
MVQHKGKWMITIAMAVCLIVVLGFGNQQTMATAPTKKPVINVMGSDPVNINSHRSFVTVQGEWIFYNNDGLYKIKQDGSSLQKLSSDWADNLNVVGDWIYYTRNKPRKEIYQLEMPAYDINDTYEDVTELMKIKTDGSSKTVIKSGSLAEGDPNNVQKLYVVGDIIYYADGYGRLYRMDTSGKNQKKLLDQFEEVYFYQDWIFYTNESRQLYKMKRNGTQKKLVSKDKELTLVGLSGDFIYYTKWVDSSGVEDVYKIGLKDGKTSLVKKGLRSADNRIIIAGNHLYYMFYMSEMYDSLTVGRMNLADGKTTPLYRLIRYSSQQMNIGGDFIFFDNDSASDSSKVDIFKVKLGENQVEKVGPKAKYRGK